MHEMTVYGVGFDFTSKNPVVFLRAGTSNVFVPIWIGHAEAAAILMSLHGVEPPRPQTHDLAWAMLGSLGATITHVTVAELRENTFHASITIQRNGDEVEVDSRSSDAIALALRAGATIFASDEVIEASGVEYADGGPEIEQGIGGEEGAVEDLGSVDLGEFRRFLDTVSPDEFRAEPDDE
jgi:hypothetical protein